MNDMKQMKGQLLAMIVAGLIAFFRMYVFVHFPTDILGGMIFGIGVAVLAYFIVHCWWPKLVEKRNKVE